MRPSIRLLLCQHYLWRDYIISLGYLGDCFANSHQGAQPMELEGSIGEYLVSRSPRS